MANITITLLENKRSRQAVDGLDTIVAQQAGGYSVIATEDKATTLEVRYPTSYIGQTGCVYMKNARGEYATIDFPRIEQTLTFKLPATMTVAGNTFLVFQALVGTGDNAIKTVWAPVVVPVTETSIDYRKVAMASPDILAEAIAVAAAAKRGDYNGDSCFIRFASDATGSDFTADWREGLDFLGFYLGKTASEQPRDYKWTRFIGKCLPEDDARTQEIECVLENNKDKSYTAAGISSIHFTIPEDVEHGFLCGVNVKTSENECGVLPETNNSRYPLKYMERGYEVSRYDRIPPNTTAIMSFVCDGIALYCFFLEA